jgi:hypothetical protein
LGCNLVAVQVLEKKRATKSAMQPRLVDTEYTIFDALLETMQKKEMQKSRYSGLVSRLCPTNLAALFFVVLGSATMVWVANLVWVDVSFWGKDLALIVFGSRTGEAISLGVGMTLLHYLLIGVAFLLSSAVLMLKSRRINVM